ncbi:hypothetical protein CcCBS67573_g03783 [Chytriomyces confervae]|uniref:F-box domain-containing protein n=1 Tax=Chytriomyces confervae TaxID=246404 RepID=A0A507FFM4_9FUNG|nr:hypothetical protein HDU80_005636 [Chytriomyces hyalinus]TPX74942.1 hypothetical protein CcCBS67573_g03783 [Chytriomyces confervae]
MAPAALIDQLFPTEVLIAVFKLVDERDRCRLCTVNQRWKRVLYNAPELWKRLDLSNRCTLGGDKFIEHLDHIKNTNNLLSSLFSQQQQTSSPYASLSQQPSVTRFSRITRMDLSCTGIDIDFFSQSYVAYTLSTSLTHLILSGCPLVTSGSLFNLKSLKSLTYLDISHCDNVDDLGLEVLSFFVTWLQELNLAYLFKITEHGIKKLFRMVGLRALNLLGCCRVKSYPWAITNAVPKSPLQLRELSIGEDSRIQTRGFWLLWCTWQHWDMKKLSDICPFLETIRLNMVLFDLPPQGLQILLDECKHLKTLCLVIERNTIPTLCSVAEQLRNLKMLDLTVHIGVQGEQMESLLAANALPKLKALKFHSKHTDVFTDDSLKTLTTQAPSMEYLELNGDNLDSSAMIPVVERLSTTLQSLLLHHVKLSNNAMRAIAKKCKTLRDLTISDLQVDVKGTVPQRCGVNGVTERVLATTEREKYKHGLGAANKLKWLVSDPSICMRLKKIELASYTGFSDKDLACIPTACTNLQWVDFHFSFTFPKTLVALSKHCPNLLYLRLFHSNPPAFYDAESPTPSRASVSATSATPTTGAPNASQRRPSSAHSSANRIAFLQAAQSARLSTSSRTSPFMASLYGDTSRVNVASKRDRRRGSGRKSVSSDVPRVSIAQSVVESSKKGNPATAKGKSKAVYKCSSPEGQALISFSLGSEVKKNASDVPVPLFNKKLRVLDLSGNHGLSDYILSSAFAEGLTNLHTLFLEGCDDGLTESGVVKFAEKRWKTLKRMHLRNCRGVALNVVQENFLSKSLEIDVVVDGGRVRNLD